MSNDLHRIAYVSLSAFKLFESNGGVDINIAQILQTARQNNQKNRLVGALYYGSGYFFQCLEGKKQDIDELYAKLLKDPRHKDLKILVSEPIETVGFSSWEMKFAAIDHEVRQFLRQHQLPKFNPYQFSVEMSHQLIDMLQKADEGLSKKEVDAVTGAGDRNKREITQNTVLSTGLLLMAVIFGWLLFKA